MASWGYLGEMPDHTQLENPDTNLATEIISSDGITLGKFYFKENRTPFTYDGLSQHLIDALIATEDERFQDHAGIDARAIIRAIVKVGRGGGGASTISQQLARQLFVGTASKNTVERLFQKVKEWVIATRLERQYTKEEIIAQYFNIYDFVNNADGIRSAASIYFRKEPNELSLKNATHKYGGMTTLKNALANSINTITARLMDKVDPEPVVELVKKLGIESDIPVIAPIALGTSDISVYDMVGAYSTFANKGVYTKPVMVTSIEDKNGKILYHFSPETHDVLSAETAYVTLKLMEGVTQSGSGSSLRHDYKKNNATYKKAVTGYPYLFKNSIAGKTGTTQNQSDGWFMGIVPNLYHFYFNMILLKLSI